MKKKEYSYEYEDKENSYCYPGTNILRNKFDLTDENALHAAEKECTMARYFELEKRNVTGNFDFKHLCSIHEYIFQDVYMWAGKPRTVDISKGTVFCLTQFIEPQFDELYKKLKKENFLKGIFEIEVMAERVAYYLGELNMIHPFREGNGRTQRMYIEQLCRNNGRFEIHFSKISKDEMIQASIETSVCNYTLMRSLILRSLSKI